MYSNVAGNAETYQAGSDLTDKQFHLVVSDGDEVNVPSAGTTATGVLFNNPASGFAATVVRAGEPNVFVGTGGVAVGDKLATDADGKVVTAASGDVVVGEAREAGAADTLVRITFYGQGQTVV